MNKSLQFLSGGGEMGALIRAYNWENSPIGPADKWPQSLRTTVGILLNSKFPMFLYWGPDLVCFYNDAYRFSLGNDGKHPLLLGMKGEEAFPETWHIVKPPINQVLTDGEATWSEDQLVPIYREGELKDAYWTFSFSPVKDESHQIVGVFLTLIETTEKVSNLKKLIDTNDQLAFAIDATELGAFDFNPLTNEFRSNNRLKHWFGLPLEIGDDFSLVRDVIIEKDRSRVADEIKKTLQYESGGLYETEYGIINPLTKQERVIKAKGKAWFGEDKMAYRFNGTLQDITKQAIARSIIEASEKRSEVERKLLHNFFTQAPAMLAILKGPEHVFEFANPDYLELIGNRNPIGKTVLESLPEVAEQGFIQLLDKVYQTGETFNGKEVPLEMDRGNGKNEQFFMNFTYQAFTNETGETEGILVFAYDVTELVNARKQIEASELFNRSVLESSPDCFKVLDVEGRIQFMNFNGLCQMEIDDFSAIKNKNWWTIWGSENETLVKTSIAKALNGETAHFTALCPTAKGTTKWWDVVVSPVGKPGEQVQQIIAVSRDVTEQKVAEEAIKKMAAHLKLATDSANVGTWSFDIQSQKLEWSVLHKKMWGYDEHRKDLSYEDWHKLIIVADKKNAFEKLEESKANHTGYEADYYINRANDGALRYMRSVGKYYYNDSGEAETLTGISLDITEQQESELKLKASEEKYRGIFESMDQGFSIIEMIFDSHNKPVDCVYIETNPVFEKQSGLKNVTGKTARELIPNLEDHWFQIYGKVALTGEPNRFIEGSEALGRWFETYAFRLGDQQSKKVAVLFTDITEKKQIEETLRYRKALLEAHNEANRDGLLLVDAKGKIISYNQSFVDVWRMPKKIVDAKDDNLALEFAMTQLGNPQQFVDKVKWLYKHPSETSIDELDFLDGRIIERHGYSVMGDDGTYYAWSWTFRDITEQRAQQKKSLDKKDEFISIASHEMKTPLTTAKGYIELLQLSLSEQNETALYATKANQALERLNDLVAELLDASKIQNGQLNYMITTFDFNEMVDETIENFQHSAKNHSIQKRGHLAQPITGDRARLQQVLINLLSNAVKYSPKADRVLFSIKEQGSNIELSVQDFGVGMSKQHLDKIFDRYYRVQDHAAHFQGLGIGLYISHNIIQRHDGKMWVESEPDKGSTFYFTLPL